MTAIIAPPIFSPPAPAPRFWRPAPPATRRPCQPWTPGRRRGHADSVPAQGTPGSYDAEASEELNEIQALATAPPPPQACAWPAGPGAATAPWRRGGAGSARRYPPPPTALRPSAGRSANHTARTRQARNRRTPPLLPTTWLKRALRGTWSLPLKTKGESGG